MMGLAQSYLASTDMTVERKITPSGQLESIRRELGRDRIHYHRALREI